ncbi:MAG: DinB family protein [Acidobacteria bacterium]|nr:DinB family protein [Acidobacteriota bacterium]MDW7984683.1 DinB family protein [Acidobacteriota bacterium]
MEPWLTPDEPTVSPRKADLLKGLDQVGYILETYLRDLPDEALWWTPDVHVPSIGARLQHIIGASLRLATYALEDGYDPDVLAAQAPQDWVATGRSKADLLSEIHRTLTDIRARIVALPDEALDEARPVGRRRIPGRRAAIRHQLVQHAAHHPRQVAHQTRLGKHGTSGKRCGA